MRRPSTSIFLCDVSHCSAFNLAVAVTDSSLERHLLCLSIPAAPRKGRSFALPADRDTFAEFPGLFPAFLLALSRSVFALALATARAYRYASLALGSMDMPPAMSLAPRAPAKTRTTLARSGLWSLRRSLLSRLREGSLTQGRRPALRRSAEASGACIRQTRIAPHGAGRDRALRPASERTYHEQDSLV